MNYFPGAGAAELLLSTLARYQEEVGALRRDNERAGSIRVSLKRWRAHIDTAGVPREVLADADRYVEIARDALRQTVDVDGAQAALMVAQRLFSP